MTLQWATRAGVLRHLRLGNALVRPTRVISVQNQLRRVCLAAKPRSATPQTCSVSFLISQQSRSLATATERPKAKRSSKASSGNGKTSSSAKPTKKKKKVLTEKQKEAKALRERRAQIKELKQTALVAPKKLAQSAWQLAIAAKFADIRSQYSSSQEAFKEATTVVKSLGADEYEAFQTQAEENRAANEASYESWVKSYTPAQIKQANTARRYLARLQNKRIPQLKDERLVKRPLTAYFWFLKERNASGDFKHMTGRDVLARASEEWKNMTESEKQHYRNLQAEDRTRYVREHEEVYGEAPPRSRPIPEEL